MRQNAQKLRQYWFLWNLENKIKRREVGIKNNALIKATNKYGLFTAKPAI